MTTKAELIEGLYEHYISTCHAVEGGLVDISNLKTAHDEGYKEGLAKGEAAGKNVATPYFLVGVVISACVVVPLTTILLSAYRPDPIIRYRDPAWTCVWDGHELKDDAPYYHCGNTLPGMVR